MCVPEGHGFDTEHVLINLKILADGESVLVRYYGDRFAGGKFGCAFVKRPSWLRYGHGLNIGLDRLFFGLNGLLLEAVSFS